MKCYRRGENDISCALNIQKEYVFESPNFSTQSNELFKLLHHTVDNSAASERFSLCFEQTLLCDTLFAFLWQSKFQIVVHLRLSKSLRKILENLLQKFRDYVTALSGCHQY